MEPKDLSKLEFDRAVDTELRDRIRAIVREELGVQGNECVNLNAKSEDFKTESRVVLNPKSQWYGQEQKCRGTIVATWRDDPNLPSNWYRVRWDYQAYALEILFTYPLEDLMLLQNVTSK